MPRRSVAARVPLDKRPLATLARDYRLPPYAAQAAAYADTVGADALDRHYTGARATLARIRLRLAQRASARTTDVERRDVPRA